MSQEASLKTYYPYIGGKSWESAGQELQPVISPFTGQTIANIRLATASDIDAAIAHAVEAQKSWGKTLASERETVLLKAADIVARRRMEIVKILIEEGGSVFGKAMFECDYMISTFRVAAGQARDVRGETMPADAPNRISMTLRLPLGVIAGIGPFNAPFLLNGKKMAPALAAGNAFILKPSPYTPLMGLMIGEIMHEAGLPPGVLAVLPTTDAAIGEKLFSNPGIAMVTFTGSAKVGFRLNELAGRYSKKLVLELGGKSPIVILKDADLDYAVSSAAFGIYFNQGQVCMANSRIIVEADVYDDFCARFAKKVKEISYGDPALPTTAVGPLISKRQVEFVQGHIKDAVAKGARLIAGGGVQGNVMAPAALADVKEGMECYAEESFGPLSSIYKAADYEDAVRLANDTAYGLSSGIVTNDLQKAFDFALRMNAGAVHINDNSFDDDPNAPFGGMKNSGHGRENGRYSIEDMTQLKWITIQMGRRGLPF